MAENISRSTNCPMHIIYYDLTVPLFPTTSYISSWSACKRRCELTIRTPQMSTASFPDIQTTPCWTALYLRFRVWFGLRFLQQLPYRSRLPPFVNIGFGQCIKTRVCHNEAVAIELVSQQTSIPVPRIYGLYRMKTHPRYRVWMVMERLPGVPLKSVWPALGSTGRVKVAQQLKQFVDQLRRLEQPADIAGRVCSVSGKEIICDWLSLFETSGPFDDFEAFLIYYTSPIRDKEARLSARAYLRERHTGLFFTHGDLQSKNILVDPTTCNVTAIVDWETASWMPIWWEAARMSSSGKRTGKWARAIAKIGGEWPQEYEILAKVHAGGVR